MPAVATIIAVDPGTKRIGLAIADLETRFARPLAVIAATSDATTRIAELAREHAASRIVVGRPIGLSGKPGPAVDRQQGFVAALRAATDVPIEEFDERLTTAVAETVLRHAGTTRKNRDEIRDAVAAQVLLQGFLDAR